MIKTAGGGQLEGTREAGETGMRVGEGAREGVVLEPLHNRWVEGMACGFMGWVLS